MREQLIPTHSHTQLRVALDVGASTRANVSWAAPAALPHQFLQALMQANHLLD
jgi:hypothetical protein